MSATLDTSGAFAGKTRQWGARLCLVEDHAEAGRILGRAMLDLGFEITDVLQEGGPDGVTVLGNSMGGDEVPAGDAFLQARRAVLAKVDPRVHRWVAGQERIVVQDDFLERDPDTYTEFMNLPRDFGYPEWRTKISIPHRGDGRGLSVGAASTAPFERRSAALGEVRVLADLYCSLHADAAGDPTPIGGDAAPALHPKQVECLRWVAAGKTYEDIADLVGISRRTVRYHLEAARERYGFATVMQTVVQAAMQYGFDPLGGR